MITTFLIIGLTITMLGFGSTCWLLGAEIERRRLLKYIMAVDRHISLPE